MILEGEFCEASGKPHGDPNCEPFPNPGSSEPWT